ncbi:MAG: hypothetical protein WCS70_11785 [Verrucomicrobiota bacterium]
MQIPTLTDTQQCAENALTQHFPGHDAKFLRDMFALIGPLFAGQYPGFQACDCPFHDLTHTLQATLALARLLDGHIRSGAAPTLTARDVELAIAGILLHDSGYFKETGDNEGTGAKFTPIHVGRSAAFAARCLPAFGVQPDEVRIVQNAIHSTGADVRMARLAFRNDRERFIGCALGTADILGQMAAADYPERLPGLYREFNESALMAAPDSNTLVLYASAKDLMRRTRRFYTVNVQQMLDKEWSGVHRAYAHHFRDGTNQYFAAIETNLNRIDDILSAAR